MSQFDHLLSEARTAMNRCDETLKIKTAMNKQKPNKNGTPVKLVTNLREISLLPGKPIYLYDVTVKYAFTNSHGIINIIEVSALDRKNSKLEQDKKRCRKVFNAAMDQIQELKHGAFYDDQGLLCSFTKLKMDKYLLTFSDGISSHPFFLNAEFSLEPSKKKFEWTLEDVQKRVHKFDNGKGNILMDALHNVISSMANSEKVFTSNDGTIYLKDSKEIGIDTNEFREGLLSSKVGLKSCIKVLEGTCRQSALYLSTEIKTDLFHPSNTFLIDIMKSFDIFHRNLDWNSEIANRIASTLNGLDFILNFGKYKELQEDEVIMKIEGFSEPYRKMMLEDGEALVRIDIDFHRKHGIALQYPNTMVVSTKSPNGDSHIFPPEVVLLYPNQQVKSEQLGKAKYRKSEIDEWRKESPDNFKARMDVIFEAIFSLSTVSEFLKIKPVEIAGIILEKPKFKFHHFRNPSDNSASHVYKPKHLSNWTIAFVLHEEIPELPYVLKNQFERNGMHMNSPSIEYIMHNDLELVFQRAQMSEEQLVLFVTKEEYNYHEEIQWLEQKYKVLSQEMSYESALEMIEDESRFNDIPYQINIKLGGLNYLMKGDSFGDPSLLIIAFSLSKDLPLAVGFSANVQENPQKFSGGYLYIPIVNRSVVSRIFFEALMATNVSRGILPGKIVMYFEEIEEHRWSVVDDFFCGCNEVLKYRIGNNYTPEVTMIISSQQHKEHFFSEEQNQVFGLAPGTIIDHTVVSSVNNEFYHYAAPSDEGGFQPVKYTIVNSSHQINMEWIEKLTNTLCYSHQVGPIPINIPSPIKIAHNAAKRGSRILKNSEGPIILHGVPDNYETNLEFGYGDRLFRLGHDSSIDH